ncbi:MAG: Gfo/Idh/MocA family oxidoreductase [Patescibacteria group bacterium]
MRFLVIGLGSMGKRRIRNLFANDEKDVVGFDVSADRRKEAEEKHGIKTVADIIAVASNEYDAMIISTPPNLHAPYIKKALDDRTHFFVETTTSDEMLKEAIAASGDGIIRAPSCTFRHFAPIKMIKRMVEEGKIGKVLAYDYHLGQYLPDWHPWEDYRNVFFSKKETGACRELFPFELCWINWLVSSPVSDVTGFLAHISDLDMEADDILSASLVHGNDVRGNVLIDVISRKPLRTLTLMGSEGVIEWDWMASEVRVKLASKETEIIAIEKGKTEEGYIIVEEMYVEEIKAFLDAIRGISTYPYTFEDVLRNLETLSALEDSAKRRE